jgi:hypothetical protein
MFFHHVTGAIRPIDRVKVASSTWRELTRRAPSSRKLANRHPNPRPKSLESRTPAKEEAMSSLSVNSLTNPYQAYAQNASNQQQSTFQTLSNALSSGNLSAAQTAFASIQQSNQNQSGQQSNQSNSSVNNDIQSLANALNSGNVGSAQQAFAQLQKDMQTQQVSGHHHHHHGGGSDNTQSQAVQSFVASLASSSGGSSSSSSTTGNNLNVTA